MPTTVDAEVQRLVRAELDREEQARIERIRQAVLAQQAALQAEDDHEQRIAELRDRIAVDLDTAPLEAARAELAGVLDRYVATCADYDRRHSALWTEIANLAGTGRPMPADLATSHTYGGMISVGGTDIRRARTHSTLVQLAQAACETHRPPNHIDWGRSPQD